LLCVMFFLSGLILIPYLGPQEDEVMFATDLFLPNMAVARFTIWPNHLVLPSMMMSYVGALKSLIYAPLLYFCRPSAYVLRTPALLMAALTVFLLYQFVLGICGPRAALIATALLATDSTYLITSCFDWGPVVLQHLLLVAGSLSFCKFFLVQR